MALAIRPLRFIAESAVADRHVRHEFRRYSMMTQPTAGQVKDDYVHGCDDNNEPQYRCSAKCDGDRSAAVLYAGTADGINGRARRCERRLLCRLTLRVLLTPPVRG